MLAIAGKLDSKFLGNIKIGWCTANGRSEQRRPVRTGPVWHSHDEILQGSVGDRYDLVKRFLLANHSQISTRAFFGCVTALLKVYYLGVERAIAITQQIIKRLLLGDCIAQPYGFSVAIVRKPELDLQAEADYAEQNQ